MAPQVVKVSANDYSTLTGMRNTQVTMEAGSLEERVLACATWYHRKKILQFGHHQCQTYQFCRPVPHDGTPLD